ncbi:MAG: phosphoglucosamine mutase [Saprospirales bacterium]|nr:MAG: phosphoglucosamine mutase [Saprospirales bacterium]
MTLIKSISGIRGTIGGESGQNLTPPDIVGFISAYASLLKRSNSKPLVVIGRDGRVSGQALTAMVASTLAFCGIDVIDCGLSTTPSVEMAVIKKGANGGIICTASHNPKQWNALKFLDEKGEFISAELGTRLVQIAENAQFEYAVIEDFGEITDYPDSIADHISAILEMETVDPDLIRSKNWTVVVDGINSTGSIAIPALMARLGLECITINGDDFGNFAHDPEPLPKHLHELSKKVVASSAVLGIAVDPDVDRLVFISENGQAFGEEYTLVAIADYYLQKYGSGTTVSNLSSSLALQDLTKKTGGNHYYAEVGEKHVVNEMKKRDALIGGEGNGGVIFPDLHYGRDAVAGVAVFLTFLAKKNMLPSELRNTYPVYHMGKDKINLPDRSITPGILEFLKKEFPENEKDERDGLKIYFDQSWIHIRSSNTEPVLRIYTEAKTVQDARKLSEMASEKITEFLKTINR